MAPSGCVSGAGVPGTSSPLQRGRASPRRFWRYSRISGLDLDRYAPCRAEAAGEIGLDALPSELADLVAALGLAATVLISHNGGRGALLRPQPGLHVEPAGQLALGAAAGAGAGLAADLGGLVPMCGPP